VPLPNLNVIPLPDLGGPDYPFAAHAPVGGCTDPGLIAAKACWPFAALIRVRIFALPTEPLGTIRHAFLRIRNLFPVPPSIGVHCPTVIAPAPTVQVVPGSAGSASWTRVVTQPSNDACQIRWTDLLQLPCVIPDVSGGNIKDSGGAVVGSINVSQHGTGCGVGFSLSAVLISAGIGPTGAQGPTGIQGPTGYTGYTGYTGPAASGGGGSVAGVNFIVVGAAYGWADSLACSTCTYATEVDIPDLIDVDGTLVAAGEHIGSTPTPDTDIVANGGLSPIICGDRVTLVLYDDAAPRQWLAYKS
jgi:hypothetical protein